LTRLMIFSFRPYLSTLGFCFDAVKARSGGGCGLSSKSPMMENYNMMAGKDKQVQALNVGQKSPNLPPIDKKVQPRDS
jgi:hypothetical protein